MELYYVMSIIDRDRTDDFAKICGDLDLSFVLVNLGLGTATSEHLSLHDLEPSEKAIIGAVTTHENMKQLMKTAKRRLFIDIPGNGIMMAIPLKSVCGGKSLAYLTAGQTVGGANSNMKEYENELIVVVLNEGFSDKVMDAARSAGATGGTLLHAKGTGKTKTEKFYGVSLAEERDLVYILASASQKGQIMQAINSECGMETEVGALCFSVPVSDVAGVRKIDEE